MERRHHVPPLFHPYRIALVPCDYMHALAHPANHGRAYEHRLDLTRPFGRNARDARIDLPSVSVALHSDVHQVEARLRRVGDIASEEDRSRARSVDGLMFAESPERFGEILGIQQLED